MHTRRLVVKVAALCALFVSNWMLPDAAASEGAREPARPLAEMTLSASHIDWRPADSGHLTLTVAGPEGLWLRREFEAGQPASLSLSDLKGERPPDGTYTWELRVVSLPGTSERSLVESGHFFVKNGSFVPARKEALAAPPRPPRLITAESHIGDDLSVRGNVCIGTSCADVTHADYSALKLKAPQPNILFDDDFVEGGSTPHDWALFINPSSAAEFSIADFENGLIPFTIAGGAPNSSVYVADNGNLGLGTATPGKDIHAMSGNTPTLRLEQDTSGSLSARTWDVGANHTELFVKDVTNSSSVPFRIKSGAPGDSLVINSTGNVGIGTSSPGTKLHLFDNTDVFTILAVQNTGSGVNSQSVFRAFSNTAFVSLQVHGGGRTLSRFGQTLASWGELVQSTGNGLIIGTAHEAPIILGTNSVNRLHITGSGNIGIGTTSPIHPLQMASGAHVTAGGVWTNASSRELKHDIRSLDAEEARSTLARLEPVRFRYNADAGDESLGFIAEDVPDLVATVDHKTLSPMDLVAVLTRVVQEQQKAIGDLQATVTSLSGKLAAMEEGKENGAESK